MTLLGTMGLDEVSSGSASVGVFALGAGLNATVVAMFKLFSIFFCERAEPRLTSHAINEIKSRRMVIPA